MGAKAFFRTIAIASLLVGSQACNLGTVQRNTSSGPSSSSGNNQVVTLTQSPMPLSCSATVPAGVTVVSGVPVDIIVTGSGGLAPYAFPGESGTFPVSGSFTRSYVNSLATSIVVDDQVTIQDSQGNETACTFSVTVQPEGTPPSTLACTITSSVTSAPVNTPVSYTVTSTGGVGTRTYGSFVPGDSGTFTSPFNPTTGTAAVSYATTGQKTSSITVYDSVGNSASCSNVVMIVGTPTVSVAVSPSTTQPQGATFTLTASTQNFLSPPTTYTFTPSVSGVTVIQSTPSSPVAQVYSTSQSSFQITVQASTSSQSASTSVTLTYTSAAFTCTLTHASGTYYPGDQVTFNVTSSTGEPVVITYAQAQDGAGYYVNSTVNVVFSSAGTKTVTVRARTPSGKLCNQGANIQDTVAITPSGGSLTCSAFSNRNPAGVGQSFVITVVPSPSSGFVRITQISSDRDTGGGYYSLYPNGLQASMVIFRTGTYNLTYTIYDPLSGSTGQCSSQQNIR